MLTTATRRVRAFWAYYLPLDFTLAFSAIYEIIEMIVGKIVSPGAGDAYLGTQGEVWDSKMEMSCAFVRVSLCTTLVALVRRTIHKGPESLAGEKKE